MGLFRAEGAVYKPVQETDTASPPPQPNQFYLTANVKELEDSPLYVPLHPYDSEDLKEQEIKHIDSDLSPPEKVQQAIDCLPLSSEKQPFFHRWTVLDYSKAYSSGDITPRMVAERFIAAVRESSNPPMKMSFFINYNEEDILKQATESTLRYKKGEPISVLDGVLIAVKDEIDCSPYPTTGGTKWLHKVRPCTGDACCVMRLRLCGAILVGKTNMHELGAGTSGINPHYGVARNPYDPSKITGGSSSGSAAVVAAGLCPVALGVDGGGSVRMPAALCGVVGFKPTFGRIPLSGVLPLNWTVGMVGILAATVEDALVVYAAINGPLPSQQPTVSLPKVSFPLLKSATSISAIKLANDDIRVCCSRAVDKLCERYGWKVRTLNTQTYQNRNCSDQGWDARVALSVYGSFSSQEYIKAQKIRNHQMQIHRNVFAKADVIVVPTTGVTAYEIKDDALKTGELDYIYGAALVRYQIAGNFLGLPAVTVPVGYDTAGLPIGLQFIGKPWSEPTLMHLAFAMQALYISEFRKPKVFHDLLYKE
ncbi:Amidase domain-containing protein [Citrus sinensis]|uniref:Amidase domain-containing protein n=1 Tax=Citrus sinensis TaxID=2711 RepID=A0ACB8JI53_CITSI|nr:Amidase domain-containing protein [Citrus sinensis]